MHTFFFFEKVTYNLENYLHGTHVTTNNCTNNYKKYCVLFYSYLKIVYYNRKISVSVFPYRQYCTQPRIYSASNFMGYIANI